MFFQVLKPVFHFSHTVERFVELHEFSVQRDHQVGHLRNVAFIVVLKVDSLEPVETILQILSNFFWLSTVGKDGQECFV